MVSTSIFSKTFSQSRSNTATLALQQYSQGECACIARRTVLKKRRAANTAGAAVLNTEHSREQPLRLGSPSYLTSHKTLEAPASPGTCRQPSPGTVELAPLRATAPPREQPSHIPPSRPTTTIDTRQPRTPPNCLPHSSAARPLEPYLYSRCPSPLLLRTTRAPLLSRGSPK